MDGFLLAVIASIGSLAFFAGIFLLARQHEKRRTARLLAEAAARGWECVRFKEGRVSGYRLRGTTRGVGWELESSSTTSATNSSAATRSAPSQRTRWQSAGAALAEGLVLIGPRSGAGGAVIPDLESLGGLAGMVVRKALEWMLGEDAERLSGLREVSLGSGALREHYMVWAHDERAARRLFTFEVERALTAWPAQRPLVVKLNPRGIQLEVWGAQLLDAATLEQLVELGARLVAAWQM